MYTGRNKHLPESKLESMLSHAKKTLACERLTNPNVLITNVIEPILRFNRISDTSANWDEVYHFISSHILEVEVRAPQSPERHSKKGKRKSARTSVPLLLFSEKEEEVAPLRVIPAEITRAGQLTRELRCLITPRERDD